MPSDDLLRIARIQMFICLCCCSMQEMYELKRHEHVAELQKKEEETRQMFVVRVKEKEAELKDAEKDVNIFFCNPD